MSQNEKKESAWEERLAVCSWSLQPTDPQDLVDKLKATGVRRVQLALDPLRQSPAIWGGAQQLFRENNLMIVSGMFGCVGEDYSTMDRIRHTGGLAPDATWEQNRQDIEAAASIAAQLGLKLITFHAGFLPHDESDPAYATMLARVAWVADLFAARKINITLETGQETAPALALFLEKLNRPNVGVNFDPANMILYNTGSPITALRVLLPWVRQVHIKDAVRTKTPGTWGEEVPAGSGEVNWREFLAILRQAGFKGHLVIEREAGAQRVADVQTARTLLEKELRANETVLKTGELATPARKVNVAVVGLGFMGVTHLRAYLALPTARVVAVCDATRLPVNGVLRGVVGNVKTETNDIDLGPAVKVCRTIEEVLANPEVDLVDICTPTPLHPQQSIAALKAGKHVLCEKPLARTSAAAREILKESELAGRFLMPAMCLRFWPGWSWLKEMVQTQPYGKILAARFRRVSEKPTWSAQGTYTGAMDIGGALFDLHIHDTDFVNFLFGRPSGVFSSGVLAPTGSADHVVTQYIFPGGPVVSAEGGWLLTQGFNMSFTLHCERATLDYDLARGTEAMQLSEKGHPAHTLHYDFPDGYGAEIRYMLECVASGRPPAIVTAADAVTALEICEAEEKSIRTGAIAAL